MFLDSCGPAALRPGGRASGLAVAIGILRQFDRRRNRRLAAVGIRQVTGRENGCSLSGVMRAGDDEGDSVVVYAGSYAPLPVDLEAEALEGVDGNCHVCDSPADVVVAKSKEVGSAIVFCDEDFRLASTGQKGLLVQRLAVDAEPGDDLERTATWLMEDLGQHVRIVR